MDYTVVHSASHGPGEEGKDVIAWDPKGKATAFQLKRGKVLVGDWRTIQPQLVDLVEQPIKHPSMPSDGKHNSVFVTTGNISEGVSSRILGQNQNWHHRKFKQLRTWVGAELLVDFLDHTGSFLPQDIPDFHRLLSFMIGDGDSPLDKTAFDLLLQSILPLGENIQKPKQKDLARTISASTVIVEYAMAGFDREENYFARIEAYTMLASYIWAAAIRWKLQERLWLPTLAMIEAALDRFVGLLAKEAFKYDAFTEKDLPTEPMIGPYRTSICAGALAAHGLWCMLGGKSEWYADSERILVPTVSRFCQDLKLPAESFVPAAFLASQFLRQRGKLSQGDKIFLSVLRQSIYGKQVKTKYPLRNPYLPVEEAMLRHLAEALGFQEREPSDNVTHTAWPLVLIAAKRLMRQDLEHLWYPITSLEFAEVIPSRVYERFLWRTRKGKYTVRIVPRPSTWEALRKEANQPGRIPNPLVNFPHWLPYYLLVFPQRFNPATVLALDDAINAAPRYSR